MTTTDQFYPEHHRLWLTFTDRAVEKQYRLSYEAEIRGPLRFGIIISILAWLSGLTMVYTIIPEKFASLSLLTILVICPFFLFIVFATMKERLKGWIHILGAMSNGWAGLYAIYFCNQFPSGATFTLPVLIFIIFFGSYLVRLRWVAGFIAALLYTAGFHYYMAAYAHIDGDQLALLSFIAWLTLIFAILAGHMAERNSRIRFVQRETIQAQNTIIAQEKEASEALLLNILPPFIAKRLKAEEGIIADKHVDASVMFVDIVGFTEMSSNISADQLITLLNHIFSHFDRLTEDYEMEKIKTIGDGYMVAGGLTRNKENHLGRMAKLSLDMIEFIQNDEICLKSQLQIRIGINSGSVIAGVIGTNKFSYDLWGDAVNTASRMESQGEVGKICVSEVVKLRLEKQFTFEKRELLELKGKGSTQSYFLIGEKEF